MSHTKDNVIRRAKEELAAESFREAVEKEKTRLRNRRPLLDRLIPFRIVFIPKEKN